LETRKEVYTSAIVKIIWVPDKRGNKCKGCFFDRPEAKGEGDNCTDNITSELNILSCRSGGHYIGVYVDEIEEGD